jgi:N-acetyl-anhydromuramyl-L-alanine amidase AmpD
VGLIRSRYNPYGAHHQTPRTIIVHAMAEYVEVEHGQYEHAPDFLLRSGLSAHALAAPDGIIYRCRNDEQGAYHALGFNTDSLGIEIMVAGHHNYAQFATAIAHPYLTDMQYEAVLEQCREWLRLHSITRVTRHSDISPGRKIDPGAGFPWQRFITDLGIKEE